MGIISVTGPQFGQRYNVSIAGNAPTPEEQSRIDQFVGQQEALMASRVQERFGAPAPVAPEAPVEEDDGTAIGRGFQRGLQGIRSLTGTTIEEAGRALGLEGVQEFGRGMETAAEEEFRKLQEVRARTGLYDVEDLSSALTYGGETFGEQAPILAQTLAGTAAGAAIGSAVPIVGTGIGAVVGGAIASLPLLFGGNVQRQEEQVAAGELDEVSVQRALATAIPQAALEGIAGRILAFTPLRPGVGNVWARAGKGGAAGVVAEVPTEITQQLLERAQAGLPIDSDDAIKEYVEAGVAAGILGGPIGAAGGVVQRDVAPKELDDDYKELALEGDRRIKFAEETERQIAEDRAKALASAGIDPDAPLGIEGPQQRLALPAPETVDIAPETAIADEEFANLSFNKAQYERVLQQVKADITSGKKINIPAIQQRVKADMPDVTVPKVRDIMKELQARDFVVENPVAKKNKYVAKNALAPEVNTPDVSYRRQIDTAADFIKADQSKLERLRYDLQAAEAYGRDLSGNKVTPDQVNAEIARTEQGIAKSQQSIELANQRLKTLGRDTHVPRIEKVGLPPSMKAVPVAEATPDALRPRFEAQQNAIRGMKEQITSVNKQVRKLNENAKKRTLSSIELDRMQKLQQQQAELSTRLGEAQANLKTPEKIFQEAKGEQFREQERQREIERKLVAARARAAADQVKAQEDQGMSPISPAFNAKQANVFAALKKRLTNLGLKDVRLEGAQRIEGAEGSFDPVTKVLSLAMGLYDPKMTDQQLFDAISEVMNHEVIHALRAMGLLKPNEIKVLERVAEKTKYVKRTKDGTQKRNYTYLDRAKKLYPDLTPTQQKEEAIAEMFRDYTAGRLKLGGGPRALFEKIKKFFKSLVGANVDQGFTRVEDIFQGIRRGEIGARDRVAPAAQPAAAAPMQSRIPATEEDIRPQQDIRMPINPNLPNDQVRAQIQRLTDQNRPLVKRLIKRIDEQFGTKSGDNVKDLSKVTQKARRPSILAAKPWHDVSHIRDSYRFKTVVDDFRNVPAIFDELLADGVGLVKIDTNKLFAPKEWGWRIIAFDLRMPNGQLVEWYLPLKELEAEKKAKGHLIFEEWRNKTQEELSAQRDEYFASIRRSYEGYDQAFQAALDRMGVSRQEAEASWRSAESSLLDAARNARRSSGVGISSAASAETGLTAPSMVRTAVEPSAPYMMARPVPSSTSAKASAIVSTSDDYMLDAPVEERPLFSRLPRSSMVAGLRDFIKNNPDGFTIDSTTFDPAAGGFVVAPLKEAEIIVGESLPEEVLLGYIEDNKDIARAINRPVYLGGWFDSQSQQYFLDNTLIVPTAEEASYIAEAADQLAIFDLNNFEEIRTNAGIERLKQSGTYRGDAAVGYQRNLAEVGRRFAQARDQRRARIQEQLVGGLERPRQSRLVVPLTPEQRSASIIDYLNPNTGKPLFKKKAGSETLVSFANKLLELRGTRTYDIVNSEADRSEIAQIMAAEAEAALLSSRDALGWYDSTLKLAKQILYPVYPEISPTRPDGTPNPMHDPAAEHAFDYATAVTSNGMAVVDNYQFASEQYDAWKASPDGKFPVVGKGDQGGSMLSAFEFWNALVDVGYDSNQISQLLTTQLPRSEVNNILKEVFGVRRLADLPVQADTKEEADTVVSVAYVIGPKIGNGFYQNLRGNFNPLTMDRWWMRFVNRITGNPLVIHTEESLGNTFNKLWSYVSNPEGLTNMERDILRRAQENLNMTKLERSDIALLSSEMDKVWNKEFFNKAYNDKLRDLQNEGMDFEIVKGSVRGPDAERVKRLAREARPEKPAMSKAATTLVKKLKPSLEEAPRNAPDRTAMRDVANRAREILRRDLGVELTNADFQALMWYAEKRIFDAGGVKRGRGEDNDYADGAIAIAKAKGISDAKIEAALPEAERGRVRGVESQLAGDQDAGGRVGELVREPEAGDFFAPRRLTLVPEDDTIEANMTPRERAEVRQALQGAEIDPEMPRQMYSRMPVAEAYMPTRAPVDNKAGPTPIYGSIMERGRLLPVVLPKGSHRVYESGIEVGNGLFHIQQRQHDRELIENSKYKRVENAIYDLMRRWQNQGYEDGESVVGYNSRDGIVLEWRNNLAFSSPPLLLVLERGSEVQGAPLRDAYYVKTFFPVLKKKDRAAPERKAQQQRLYSRLYSTTATLAPQVKAKTLKLDYARAADFLAKGLRVVVTPDKAQAAADTILRKFQDNMLPVGRMIQELQAKGLTITDAMDTYLKEELYHGVVGNELNRREEGIYKDALDAVKALNVNAGMLDGLQRASDAASGTGDGFVKQARQSAGSDKLALAEAYLYAKHAKERNAYIRTIDPKNDSGSGMQDAEADAILRWFSSLDASNAAAIANLNTAARGIVADTNRVRVDSGLIPDQFDQIVDEDGQVINRPEYDFFVPLRGIYDPEAAESDGTTSAAGGQRFGGKGRPDPRALGRYKYATDVLANLINQNQQSVSRGERNKVGQSFLELLRANPSTTKAYAEILTKTPKRRALVSGRVREITDFAAAKDPNIFVVKEDGKDVYVELFNPNLGAALKGDNGVGAGALGYIVRSMGMVNRYLSNINTSYNPEFFITNFLRDLQAAGVNIQQFDEQGLTTQIVKDVRKALAGIKRSIRNKDDSSEWSQIYRDFVNAGGQNVTNQMSTVADQMDNIRSLVGDISDKGARGRWNQVKNSFVGKGAGSLLSFIEDYNTVVENGIRVATYKTLLDRGFTRERAAQAARNVTVNFAKGGEYKSFMNAFYLFYNASLQGSFALLNAALRSRKVQFLWAGVIAAGFLQDQLNALLSDEDEDEDKQYDKIPDYILEHNFILPDPFGFTDRSYIAIPMPYGLNMAHNIGRAASRALRGEYDAGEATGSIVGNIVDTINPLGGSESFANFVAPTVVDPFIDIIENEDFADKPIFKEAFPGDRGPDSQRYWATTNPSAIWVAQNINSLTGGTSAIPGFIDASPDVLNFWLEFATGGVGRFVQRTAELPFRVYEEGLNDELYREVPFVRKIIGSVSTREDYGRYIEKRNAILLAGDEIKEAIDNQDRERALAAREEFAEELRYLPRVRAIDNAIRQVNKQMNKLRDNRNMADEQKQAIMDRLDERKQALILRGNQILMDY